MMGVVVPERWQWTAPRYFRAVEAGLFDPDERLELIEGELIRMAPINPRHSSAVGELLSTVYAQLDRKRFRLRAQQPLAFAEDTWPEPDLAIVREGDYRKQHPDAVAVLLVIEVADSSFDRDRGPKLALYARHEIPEYWVLDVRGNRASLWVHRSPKGEEYEYESLQREGQISANSVPGVTIDLNAL